MLFVGSSADELLALPDEQLRAFALTDEPVVFRIGSSEVLGKFTVSGDTLMLELAQVDEGGEGVLPALAALATGVPGSRGWGLSSGECMP